MRITWVCPWFGNYRVPVYAHLRRLTGGEFTLVCSEYRLPDPLLQKLREQLGQNVFALEKEKTLVIGSKKSNFANSYVSVHWQKGLYRAICDSQPDVVITEGFFKWSPAVFLYALLHRKKLLLFYERTAYVERNAAKWRTWYRKIVGRLADGFLINGILTEQYLNEIGLKHIPKQLGVMAADSEELSRRVKEVTAAEETVLKQSCGIEERKGLLFLFVGQIVERKGIRELCNVWQEHLTNHPDDSLLILGTGVLQEELQRQYAGIPGICFVGAVEYDAIHRYYAASDVFIMPTLEDNWCLVLPEAMACGLPVACSVYNGGTVELIRDGQNGYAFDPHKPSDILRVLAAFHHSDLAQMGRCSQEIESHFTPQLAAERIMQAAVAAQDRK